MKFPKPRLITFDAFGTIYTPKGSVSKQYSDYVKTHHGIEVSPDVISAQFKSAYQKVESEYPSYGSLGDSMQKGDNKNSRLSIESWWSKVITLTFLPVQLPEEAVSGLYEHFNTRHAYEIYQDAVDCIQTLSERQYNIGILSNSDPRLRDVLKSMDLIKWLPAPPKDHICLSYESGYEKPHVEAFRSAQRQMIHLGDSTSTDDLWHVGDDKAKDVDGAFAAGWNSILIDRDGAYPDKKNGVFVVEGTGGPRKVFVDDLGCVPELFEQ